MPPIHSASEMNIGANPAPEFATACSRTGTAWIRDEDNAAIFAASSGV